MLFVNMSFESEWNCDVVRNSLVGMYTKCGNM
jgi:hypothetical protein